MSRVDKDSIIRAAEEVVREKGARKLTLDAVAAQCGLSKGGLLHHFRTKQALLKAMLESAVARESELAAEYAAASGGSGGGVDGESRGVLACRIQSLFALMQNDENLSRSLVAAVAEDPALLEPVKRMESRIRHEVSDTCSDPEMAQLLLFAARGLFLGRVLGVLEPEDPIYDRLRKRLLKLSTDLE